MNTENQTVHSENTQVERRRHPRRRVCLEVQCRWLRRDGATEPVLLTTANIGTRGACLVGSGLEKGEILMLAFWLPPAAKRAALSESTPCPASECQRVSVLSRVLWSRTWESQVCGGVMFLDLERDQRPRLKSFLIDLGLDQPGSPWYV